MLSAVLFVAMSKAHTFFFLKKELFVYVCAAFYVVIANLASLCPLSQP